MVKAGFSTLPARPIRHFLLRPVHLELPLPAVGLGDGVEDQPAGEREGRQEHQPQGQDGRGEPGHQARVQELEDDGRAEEEAEGQEEQGDKPEELHRPIVLEERADHHEDTGAVAHGVELGDRALGPVAVLDGHVEDPPAAVHRVDGELRLDLEAAGEHREGLHEGAGEGAVAGHHVVEPVAVDPADRGAHRSLPKPWPARLFSFA